MKVHEYLQYSQDKLILTLRPNKYERYLTMFGNVLLVEDTEIKQLQKQPWSNGGGYNSYGITPLICQMEKELFENRLSNPSVFKNLIKEMDEYIKAEKSINLKLVCTIQDKTTFDKGKLYCTQKWEFPDVEMEVMYHNN